MDQKHHCFIITPIGNDNDPIRRHIDGIIKAAIIPAFSPKYEVVVAHKISEPGSITKQVITEIYCSRLVLANLTQKNPNVMYELAFRHSLGKPVIMIAERGTSLPSDIIMERTIFYDNDAQGVLDLRQALEQAEQSIDFDKISSPIYDVVREIDIDTKIFKSLQQDPEAESDVLRRILHKLNFLEDSVQSIRNPTHIVVRNSYSGGYEYKKETDLQLPEPSSFSIVKLDFQFVVFREELYTETLIQRLIKEYLSVEIKEEFPNAKVDGIHIDWSSKIVTVLITSDEKVQDQTQYAPAIIACLNSYGFDGIELIKRF